MTVVRAERRLEPHGFLDECRQQVGIAAQLVLDAGVGGQDRYGGAQQGGSGLPSGPEQGDHHEFGGQLVDLTIR